MKKLKEILKQNPKVYNNAVNVIKILKAFKRIKINYHALKELKYDFRNSVSLGEKNHYFYSNIFNNLLKNTSSIIIDVGANDGWFAKIVFRFSPFTKVISFEPLKSMIPDLSDLKNTYSNYDYENLALGENVSEIMINEFNTAGLSSLKQLNAAYSYDQTEFDSSIKKQYTVQVTTLDLYVKSKNINDKICLKIDTQGFELEVLKGSLNLLKTNQIEVIIIELMLIEKYKNASLYDEILDFLHPFGYKLFDIHTSYYESNGQLSEFDAVFTLQNNYHLDQN